MKNKHVFSATIPPDVSSAQISHPQYSFSPPCPYTGWRGTSTGKGLAPCAAGSESCLSLHHQERRVVGLPRVHILSLPLTCCVTAGKVFELSFPSLLNWDDKIDLTIVRTEPGDVRKP